MLPSLLPAQGVATWLPVTSGSYQNVFVQTLCMTSTSPSGVSPPLPPGRDCAELSPRQTAQEQEEAKPIERIEARFSFAAILTSPPEGL